MELWKIIFTIDTGYTWFEKECIITADNQEDALKKFNEWINPQLHGENFIEDSKTKIKKIQPNKYGIIYQNYFKE